MNALIYGRFSSAPQERGDSKRRQLEGATSYAKRQNLNIVGTYFDEAVSGKAGLNLEKEFGRCLHDATNGDVILCEQIDRIGRQNPIDVLNIIKERIVDKGLSIAFWQRGLIVDASNIGNPSILFSLFGESAVGFSDNTRKMERLRATTHNAFIQGERGIQSGTLVKYLPQCFIWDEEKTSIGVDYQKAKVIRRIFDEFNRGKGRTRIAQGLNADGIPTLYVGQRRKASKGQRRWIETSISKVLANESYAGVLHVAGHRITCIPQVVEHAVWETSQVLIQRYAKRHGRFSQTRINNLFAGIAICAHCGASIGVAVSVPGKSNGNTQPYFAYRCNALKVGQCQCRHGINAKLVERAFFSSYHGGTPSNIFTKQSIELKERKAFLEKDIARLNNAIENLFDMVEQGDRQAKERIGKRRSELQRCQQELNVVNGTMREEAMLPTAMDELAKELNFLQVGTPEDDKAIAEYFSKLDGALSIHETRLKLQRVLPLIYSKVIFDAGQKTLQAFTKSGKALRLIDMDEHN